MNLKVNTKASGCLLHYTKRLLSMFQSNSRNLSFAVYCYDKFARIWLHLVHIMLSQIKPKIYLLLLFNKGLNKTLKTWNYQIVIITNII